MRRLVTVVVGCLLLGGWRAGAASESWPGFRGNGDGVSAASGIPLEWSPKKNLAWKVDLPGYGQSSPVVWEGRVYVTAIKGPNKEKNLVLALDGRTGKVVWERAFASSRPREATRMVSQAAPTPAVDAAGVYAFFESGDLVHLDHGGDQVWSRCLVKDHGEYESGHGIGSSLAQNGAAVFVLADHQGPAYLLAVSKKTGKDLWKADRKSRVAWTSPVVATLGGREQVAVSSNGSVVGYDTATGKELWSLEGLTGNTVPSAAVAGPDLLLVGAGQSRRGGDAEKAVPSSCCLRLGAEEGELRCRQAWAAPRASASFATPLAYKGCAYFVGSVGVVHCLDLKSGKTHYAERTAGPCWASPVGVGDRVYFFGKDGVTTVLRAGPRHVELARSRLWDDPKQTEASEEKPGQEGQQGGRQGGYSQGPTVYGVAVVDGAIYLRTGTALFCVRTSP